MGRLRFQILEARQPAPDFAAVFGRWRLDCFGTDTPPNGLFTLLWEKHGDHWRVVTDHTSSSH